VVGRIGGDLGDEVDAVGTAFHRGGCGELGVAGVAECARHRADIADEPCEPAGVDAGDAGDGVHLQQRLEMALGAEAAVAAGEVTDDDATAESGS
jgi:hypothetical protein